MALDAFADALHILGICLLVWLVIRPRR